MKGFVKKAVAASFASALAMSVPAITAFAEELTPVADAPEVQVDTTVTQDGWDPAIVDITAVIPEGVNDDIVTIDLLRDGVANIPALQPGDSVAYNVIVKDESGNNYRYVKGSATVTPTEQNLDNEREIHYRAYNPALFALGISGSRLESQLTDENVGKLLKAEGYGDEGMSNVDVAREYIDDYFVAYYNEKHPDAPVASADEFPGDYVQELTCGKADFSRDTISPDRESNLDMIKAGWKHMYSELLTIDGTGVLKYEKGSEAQIALDQKFEAAVFTDNATTFKALIDGPKTGNAWQNHDMDYKVSIQVAKDGSLPDEKISKPDLEKKITDGDQIIIDESGDYATVDKNGRVDFTLTSHVGEDLKDYIKPVEPADPGFNPVEAPVDQFVTDGVVYTLTFYDYLDEDFEYIDGSEKLVVNGVEITPITVEKTVVAEGQYAGRTEIKLAVDLVDLFEQGIFSYSDFGLAPIVFTYSANVKEGVEPGKMYNTAWVGYEDNYTEVDEVNMDTFGVKIFKYDQTTNNGLAGAEFKLVRVDEVTDENGEVTLVETPVAENLVSDEDGNIVVKGLKEGTYKLYETKAPAGYTKSDKPLEIVVNQENDDEEYYVGTRFANAPEVHTGGAGTMMFTTVGGIMVLAGAAYMVITKRRNAEAE